MAKPNKIQMPSGIGGLVSYHEEYTNKLHVPPLAIVIVTLLIIVIFLLMH